MIRGGEIVNASGSERADIGIAGGVIAQIGGELRGRSEMDAAGLLLLPGAIDAHVHLSSPPGARTGGPRWVDDFTSGSRAALAGGVTTVGNMTFLGAGEGPLAGLAREHEAAREQAIADFFCHPVIGDPAAALEDIPGLLDAGCSTIKCFLSFGFDAAVSAMAALLLAARIQQEWRNKYVAYAYMLAAAGAFYLGASALWRGERPQPTVLGIVVAAVSMLVIPIVGSYMKVLAVELRSQALRSAAVFTFGNSYLSMVLLIALLMSYGMNLRWGDPLGALVMFPFMAQKGIQILLEEGKHEYVED